MRYKVILIGVLSVLLSSFTFEKANTTSDLTVTVTGLRNNDGQVAIQLFNNSKGFPEKIENAIKSLVVNPTNNKAVFTVSNLPAGTYAIALMHDENRNKKMDKSLFGVPKEGFGFSKNPKIVFSAPSFSDCSFRIGSETKQLSIKLIYY